MKLKRFLMKLARENCHDCTTISIVVWDININQPMPVSYEHCRGIFSFKKSKPPHECSFIEPCVYFRQNGDLCSYWVDNYRFSCERSVYCEFSANLYE